MIKANIKDNLDEIISKYPEFKNAFDFIKQTDFKILEPIQVDPITNVSYHLFKTKQIDKNRFELHKDNVDIHYCVYGNEDIYVSNIKDATNFKGYNKEKDVEFVTCEKYEKVSLSRGDFLILFQDEAHRPGCGDGKVLEKVMVKIRKTLDNNN